MITALESKLIDIIRPMNNEALKRGVDGTFTTSEMADFIGEILDLIMGK